MASNRRLDQNWMLTDGVFAPFLIDRPIDVPSALRAQGMIERRPAGAQFLHEEWIYQHTFRYQLALDLPDEDDEWFALHFEHLIGQGFILLNGEIIWEFDDESVHFPINSMLNSGSNLLEVQFIPPYERAPFGIVGSVWLRSGNGLMFQHVRMQGLGAQIASDVNLECYTAGKYVFRYALSIDDVPVKQYEFIERLRGISPAQLHHELPIQSPIFWDADDPDETSYMVRLSVERLGMGCEQVFQRVALMPDGYQPLRVVRRPMIWDEQTMRFIKQLGADALLVDDIESLILPNYLHLGLLTISDAPEPLAVERAILPYEQLTAIAGDMPFWPSDAPLWKLLGAKAVDAARYDERFGVNATGDARRCIEHSRTLQASELKAQAQARLDANQPALIDLLIDPIPTPMSSALIDAGGHRPAFDALRDIWTQHNK